MIDFIYLEGIILASLDAGKLRLLASRLRDVAEAAEERAVEVELEPVSYLMANASEAIN